MKPRNIIIFIAILIAIPIAWYLISPAFRVVEVNEESPLVSSLPEDEPNVAENSNAAELMIDDMFEKMDEAKMMEFKEAVEEVKTEVKEMEEAMPETPKLLAQGNFQARAHEVAGKALLIEDDEKTIVRFEDFETINGPDLHIYLSSELGDSDYIDLGKIKATKGNVNYEISSNIDTQKYNKVLIWCVPFGVLFSYAQLE